MVGKVHSIYKEARLQARSDRSHYARHSSEGKIVVLIVDVDDIALIGDDLPEMNHSKNSLSVEFEIKDLGPLRHSLGMEVATSRKGIVVSQRKYIPKIMKETRISGCRPVDTPKDPNQKLTTEQKGEPMDIDLILLKVSREVNLLITYSAKHCFFSKLGESVYAFTLRHCIRS